jgi:biopolymer transport protein ExbD
MALKSYGEATEYDDGSGILAEINITPLTDIFLVLLIIFMVTSSVMSQLGVDVELPKADATTTQAQPGGVVLTLLPEGGMKLNDQKISAGDWDALEAALKKALPQTQDKLVILEGDRRVLLGSAIELMNRAKRAGAVKFAIATSPATE